MIIYLKNKIEIYIFKFLILSILLLIAPDVANIHEFIFLFQFKCRVEEDNASDQGLSINNFNKKNSTGQWQQ